MTNLLDIIAAIKSGGVGAALRTADQLATDSVRVPTDSRIIQCGQEQNPVARTHQVASEEEFILTDEFEAALRSINSKVPFILITGRAGTGKSTFIELLKSKLENFVIVAPTGVAALNVGGQTIHSFFRLAPGPVDFSKIERLKYRRAYQALRVLIIDEISMVRSDLMDGIDIMLRRNGPYPELPFGGVQVIAIGDLFQLAPVLSFTDEQQIIYSQYRSPFFFAADCIKQVGFEPREFTRVFRQSQEHFIKILNNIREGICLTETLAILETRVVPIDYKVFEGVILTGDNFQATEVNTVRLSLLDVESRVYGGAVSGDFSIDNQRLPAPIELELKIGCQVMFVKNDSDKRWVNGTIGKVSSLGSNFVEVEINEDQDLPRRVRVEPQRWENIKYVYDPNENKIKAEKRGVYQQLPLMLAWAVTIHKCQGKTFERAHIDLSRGAFAEGQVYVALSRCRTLEGLTLEKPLERRDIRINSDVIEFFERRIFSRTASQR